MKNKLTNSINFAAGPAISPPQFPFVAKSQAHPLMTRVEIESLIAHGHEIVIVDQEVLLVDAWLKYHPGGDKAILHMIGRDATDEVNAFHSGEAREQMLRYRIGRIEGRWKNFTPPIQGGRFCAVLEESSEADSHRDLTPSDLSSRAPSPTFDRGEGCLRWRGDVKERQRSASAPSRSSAGEPSDGMSYLNTLTHEHVTLDLEKYPAVDIDTQNQIVVKYRDLHRRIVAEGLFQCNYWIYAIESARSGLFFSLMCVLLYFEQYFFAALSLGALWHQLVFVAHDAGHMGITHQFHVDSVIGIIIANFIGGLSMGWWKRNHNVHHIVTNAPEHDPDIEYMPFFAISHRLLGNLRSSFYERVMSYDAAAKIMLRIQPWTYYPFLALARFNLYFLSWEYLMAGRGPKRGPAAWHRWLELAGQVFFWIWFGYGVLYRGLPNGWSRFMFLMVSHVSASPLHVQIVLSHFAMSTADLGPQESFPQKMLRTTMDVDCPPWLDFLHGGLQFQVIHHLFPRMPRHNLRRAQYLVREFCIEASIPYALYGFTDSNKRVIGRLAEVSRQAAILSKCQSSIMQSDDFYTSH